MVLYQQWTKKQNRVPVRDFVENSVPKQLLGTLAMPLLLFEGCKVNERMWAI